MRDARAVARVVGRRTALRCLAAGVGASLLAACAGKGGGEKGEGGEGAASGPTGKAFAAFVRGTWRVDSTSTRGEKATGIAVVEDGTWSMTYAGLDSMRGTWSLRGGRLALRAPESPRDPEDLADAAATQVPATVGDSVSVVLPWQPPGAPGAGDGQKLDVAYNAKEGVLRIRHIEASGSMTIHSCTRA
ncbi:hypothetical protein ACWCP6_02390 [Streptomyces sp. NPDC002004]